MVDDFDADGGRCGPCSTLPVTAMAGAMRKRVGAHCSGLLEHFTDVLLHCKRQK
jgi:hypothetical protein